MVQPDVPGVTVQQRRAAGYQAQLQGTLVVDEITNCLVVRKGTIQVWQVDVAWPQGWSVAVRGSTIVLVDPAGRTFAKVGDRLALAGGYVEPARAHCVSCTKSSRVFAASGEMRLL
jgi:hypothetical protein